MYQFQWKINYIKIYMMRIFFWLDGSDLQVLHQLTTDPSNLESAKISIVEHKKPDVRKKDADASIQIGSCVARKGASHMTLTPPLAIIAYLINIKH